MGDEDGKNPKTPLKPPLQVVESDPAERPRRLTFDVPVENFSGDLVGFSGIDMPHLRRAMWTGFARGMISGNYDPPGSSVKSPRDMGKRERMALLRKLVSKAFQINKPKSPTAAERAAGLKGDPGLQGDDVSYAAYLDAVGGVLREQGFTPEEISTFHTLARTRRESVRGRK